MMLTILYIHCAGTHFNGFYPGLLACGISFSDSVSTNSRTFAAVPNYEFHYGFNTTKTDIISVSSVSFIMPGAQFTASPTNGTAPLTFITFTYSPSTTRPGIITILETVQIWPDRTLSIPIVIPVSVTSH